MSNIDLLKIEEAVKMILEAVGEDVNREGLLDTPKRVAKMYAEMFSGLHEDAKEYFKTVFHEDHEELVPFYGKAHVAYIPNDGVVAGLSKLGRAVETIARRPQLQERITSSVADTIMEMLSPKGVYVVIEAEHMCMTMRGLKKPGSKTVTSVARGIYEEDEVKRREVLSFIQMS